MKRDEMASEGYVPLESQENTCALSRRRTPCHISAPWRSTKHGFRKTVKHHVNVQRGDLKACVEDDPIASCGCMLSGSILWKIYQWAYYTNNFEAVIGPLVMKKIEPKGKRGPGKTTPTARPTGMFQTLCFVFLGFDQFRRRWALCLITGLKT